MSIDNNQEYEAELITLIDDEGTEHEFEIIDELEPVKRGIYAGAVGYLGFHGDMDLAIAIRTAVVKDGKLHVQAGAGIVADSDPSSEWQETQNKARAVLRAAELAEQGLDTRFE